MTTHTAVKFLSDQTKHSSWNTYACLLWHLQNKPCFWSLLVGNGNKAKAVHLAAKGKQSWFEFAFSCLCNMVEKKSSEDLVLFMVYSSVQGEMQQTVPCHAMPCQPHLRQDGTGMPLWWCGLRSPLLLFCVVGNVCTKPHHICLHTDWNVFSRLHLVLIISLSVHLFLFLIASDCVSSGGLSLYTSVSPCTSVSVSVSSTDGLARHPRPPSVLPVRLWKSPDQSAHLLVQ